MSRRRRDTDRTESRTGGRMTAGDWEPLGGRAGIRRGDSEEEEEEAAEVV